MKQKKVHSTPVQQKTIATPFFRSQQKRQGMNRVSRPQDPFETEADKMAAKVVDRPTEAFFQAPLFREITPLVQRSTGTEEAQRVPDDEYRGVQAMPEDRNSIQQETQTTTDTTLASGIQNMEVSQNTQAATKYSEDPSQQPTQTSTEEKLPGQAQYKSEDSSTQTSLQKETKNNTQSKAESQPTQTSTEEKIQEKTQYKVESQPAPKTENRKSKIDSPQSREVGCHTGPGVPVPQSISRKLQASKGRGKPLPESVRQEMEAAFGVDFSEVHIHTDATAVYLSDALSAQAFAHGRDVYFNIGKFDPHSRRGKYLLAHELTHTVQQGAARPLRGRPGDQGTSPVQPKLQGSFLDELVEDIVDLIDRIPGYDISDIIRYIPGYDLMSYLLEYDFLRQRRVEPSAQTLIKALMGLVPGGAYVYDRLEERGIVSDAIDWINGEMSRLDLSLDRITRIASQIWDESSILEGVSWNLRMIERKFMSLYDDVVEFAGSLLDEIVTMIKNAFLELLAELAKELEGYDLLTDLLGEDPISGEKRNATTEDILRGILQLPIITAIGGDKLLKKLDEHDKLKEAADWIDMQWALLTGSFEDLMNIATKFLEGFSVSTLEDPMGFVNGIKDDVIGFITKITTFFNNLAEKALELIREVSLWLLDTFISKDSPAWDLVVFVFGKNPVTGKAVPRDYLKLIGAFIKMLPNGDSLYAKFIETGALEQMVDWVSNAIKQFISIIGQVKESFLQLWAESTIDDLFDPVPFFQRMFELFKQPIGRLLAFVKDVIVKLFRVLAFIMNIPEDVVQQIIDNVISAYQDIKKDPVQFLLNLLKAVKEGFNQFFTNIFKHLLDGVTGWMFGKLAEAGITIPKTFDMPSLLNLVFDILGLTMENIWARLAKLIGQEKVDMIRGAINKLKGVWEFIKDIKQNGLSAIWKYIKEKVKDFWTMILNSAKEWIMTQIINKVTAKLLTMLDPTGVMAVVNGFIAFYKAVETLVEQLNAMLKIVASFTKGMAEIAKGAVANAAVFLEQSLAKGLTVAIAFLANQAGLGGISEKIREVIQKIRDYVNKGIDWLLEKAVKGMQSIIGLFTGKDNKSESAQNMPSDKNKELAGVDPKDHKTIASLAVRDMETPEPDASGYTALRTAKEKQAKSVEQLYSNVLEQGIKLRVRFFNKAQDAGDNDIDFEVIIAPNDYKTGGTVKVEGTTFEGGNFIFENGKLAFSDGKTFEAGKLVAVRGKAKSKDDMLVAGGFNFLHPKKITAIKLQEAGEQQFVMITLESGSSYTAKAYKKDWTEANSEVRTLSETELAEANQKEDWTPNRELARKVLNYRYHNHSDHNPSGKEWEHIVEHSTGGRDSSSNLALITGSINQSLGTEYGKFRIWNKYAVEEGRLEKIKLRDYLSDKSVDVQREWKLHVYQAEYNVSLSGFKDNGRGRFREIA